MEAFSSRLVELGPVDATGNLNSEAIALAVIEAGQGGRPLLALHGFTGAKEDFLDTLGPLADQGWHAVSADLRGHGASSAPLGQENYSFGILTEDIGRLIQALGWSSCVVIGHSMGGILAQRLTIQQPDVVDALVLLDTFCGPVLDVEIQLVQLGSAIVASAGMAALADAMAALREAQPLSSAVDVAALSDAHRDYTRAKLLATSPDLWLALAPRFLSLEPWGNDLRAIRVPTAVVVGQHDASSMGYSHEIAQVIRGARLEVIAGAGHSPQFEAPEAWWSVLSEFLEVVADSLSDDEARRSRRG